MALVDRDGLYGMPRFHKAAQAAGVRAIVGVELTIDDCRLSIEMHHSRICEIAPIINSIAIVQSQSSWTLPVLVSSRARAIRIFPVCSRG